MSSATEAALTQADRRRLQDAATVFATRRELLSLLQDANADPFNADTHTRLRAFLDTHLPRARRAWLRLSSEAAT